MAEIWPIRRKTLYNRLINLQSLNTMKIERYQMNYLCQMKYYTLMFHKLLGVESHRKNDCVKKEKQSFRKYQLELRTIPTFMIYLKFSRDKGL